VLEDVCDNLFNADPYYQQGGDMVRVGGLTYTCTPAEASASAFPNEARQRPGARGRQELQGGGLGLVNEQKARRCGMWSQTSARGQGIAGTGGAGVTLKGVEDNPGIAGQG
jgi:sulfur-oxidizing protein SoxB